MEKETGQKQKAMHITRRMFLQMGFWVSGLASAWGVFRFLSYEAPGEKLLPMITLDEPTVYIRGTALFIPEVKAWLIRDDAGLYAVSATCTHLGCNINGEEDKFVCPCHGSQFDLSGRVLQGPATTALAHYLVSLSEDGLVVIDRRSTVPPTHRL
ncbi:MAG: ubiquinol-cytochrome c reductase iron-sulfur subunit [Chloroflexota bacterium]